MKKIKQLMMLMFVLTAGTLCYAAAFSESMGSHGAGVLKKWHTVTVSFDGPHADEMADGPNPFEVELQCSFTHTKADSILVPGFYNGHNQWLVRFTPNSEGTWKWSSRSSIDEMDGISSTIEVAGNDLHNHGAIQICEDDPRTFCYEDGTPCACQGPIVPRDI